jgi:hypothetical protein
MGVGVGGQVGGQGRACHLALHAVMHSASIACTVGLLAIAVRLELLDRSEGVDIALNARLVKLSTLAACTLHWQHDNLCAQLVLVFGSLWCPASYRLCSSCAGGILAMKGLPAVAPSELLRALGTAS